MAKPTVGAPIPEEPATPFRMRGASNKPAMKANRHRQSSASFGGKSAPTMPLIPATRPLKSINSPAASPISAPPTAADKNGCMTKLLRLYPGDSCLGRNHPQLHRPKNLDPGPSGRLVD